jgi:peptidoglycan/LPS O-acetylase OafA/YrhL
MKPYVTNIACLTPLRGIAALLVAVFHFQVYFIRFITKDQSMFVDKGYLMVDLFFIMSGFLIMHVYKDDFGELISIKSFKKFMLARFARLYPLHIITLLVLVVIFYAKSLHAQGYLDPQAIIYHIFLLHAFPVSKDVTWNIPSWSISAEWWAYTLFPFLCLLLYKSKRLGVILMLLSIMTIYTAIVCFLPRYDTYGHSIKYVFNLDVTYDYGFLRSFAGFMTGMLLYLLYLSAVIKKIFNSDLLCGIYIVLILFALHKGIKDIWFVPGFAILILLFTCNTGKFSSRFNNKALNFLGDISYSVYMIHFLIIVFLEMVADKLGYNHHREWVLPFFNGAIFCIVYVLILLIISAISYRVLEKPFRKYINSKWG